VARSKPSSTTLVPGDADAGPDWVAVIVPVARKRSPSVGGLYALVPDELCAMPGQESNEHTYWLPWSHHTTDPSLMRNPAVAVWDRSITAALPVVLRGGPSTEPTNRPTAGTRSKFHPLSVE